MVLGIEQIKESVKEKGQEVEGRQERGEMVRAMAEVVFKMIALSFEGIITFILDLPARTPGLHDRRHRFRGEGERGDKRVVIELSAAHIGESELTPIDRERISTGA